MAKEIKVRSLACTRCGSTLLESTASRECESISVWLCPDAFCTRKNRRGVSSRVRRVVPDSRGEMTIDGGQEELAI